MIPCQQLLWVSILTICVHTNGLVTIHISTKHVHTNLQPYKLCVHTNYFIEKCVYTNNSCGCPYKLFPTNFANLGEIWTRFAHIFPTNMCLFKL